MEGSGRLYTVYCSVPLFLHLTHISRLPTETPPLSLTIFCLGAIPHRRAASVSELSAVSFSELCWVQYYFVLNFTPALASSLLQGTRFMVGDGSLRRHHLGAAKQPPARRESPGLKCSKAEALLPVFAISKCLIPFASMESLTWS